MNLDAIPFQAIDWNSLPPSIHAGEEGVATWRTLQLDTVRVRLVDYSPGYRADHWCDRGHVIYVVSGYIDSEVEGGETRRIGAGQSYVVGTGCAPHRSTTAAGARLFIVD